MIRVIKDRILILLIYLKGADFEIDHPDASISAIKPIDLIHSTRPIGYFSRVYFFSFIATVVRFSWC